MKTKDLVYVSSYVALAMVLDLVKEMLPFLNLPQGGSINIALIPIVVSSFHLGYKGGLFTGLIYWILGSLLGYNEWILSPMQYLLDYVVPSIILGLSCIFYQKKTTKEMILGISLTMLIRTLSIIMSGALYWADGVANGSIAAWIGSIEYNLPYSLATYLILIIFVPIVIKRIQIK